MHQVRQPHQAPISDILSVKGLNEECLESGTDEQDKMGRRRKPKEVRTLNKQDERGKNECKKFLCMTI